MKQQNEISRNKVPMTKKIAFGVGMLANQMFPAALGVFMVVLLAGFGFPAWMVALLTFSPRLLDFIMDPIMGFITDNTRSKWGKRRHYVFIGALIMGVAFLAMWQIYKENGLYFNFFYFLFFNLLLYVGLTIFSVPFVAMGYEMSDDFHERTQIMAISQFIGQWAWVIVPWFWIIMYDPKWFPNPEAAARQLSFWIGIPCMIFAMVPAIFISAKSTLNETSFKKISIGNVGGIFKDLIQEFKEAFKLKDFRKLCFSTFFTFNAFNTVAQFTFFIIVYYLFNGDKTAGGVWAALFGSGGALVTTFIVIPIVTKMSKKLGKKKAFLISQSISILGYILLFFLFIPGKPYMFLFALPLFSFGIGGLFTTMMSMTADVCDLDELNYGQRREGIFGAIYWWVVKLGFAFAGLLSYLILDLIHFNGDLQVQAPSTIFWLRLFFSAIPIFGTMVAMFFMWNYSISEEKVKEIQAKLQIKKKSKEVLPSGYRKNGTPIDFAPYPETNLNYSDSELKSVFKNVLDKGMYGICFSPFEARQKPGNEITEEQIRRKLQILKPFTQWIRVFSCTRGHELIPAIAKEMGFKTLVGAWINGDENANQLEMSNLIKLMNNKVVDIAAIGNEVLYRQELSEEKIIAYIHQVKTKTQNVPVGYVDLYSEYITHPKLVEQLDTILVNSYPYWEGCPQKKALSFLKKTYEDMKKIAGDKEIIITETGWANNGEQFLEAVPNDRNAMEYFVSVQQWSQSQNIKLFYFSSFDESWKEEAEGSTGTYWGLWNKDEKLKF